MYRRLFGALMLFAIARIAAYGWIDELYLDPREHLHYPYLEFINVPSAPVLYGLFFLMAFMALGMMVNVRSRFCSLIFGLVFLYVECLDAATYLNHYVLVTLLAFSLALVPNTSKVPKHTKSYLCALMTAVYLFAALAKVNSDWLLHGMPLTLWLAPYGIPPWLALAMSWAGFLYDLCVPALLFFRRTRVLALVLVIGFHLTAWLLFPIGIFSWLMIISATLFFEPDWPKGWRIPNVLWHFSTCEPSSRSRAREVGLLILLCLQVLVPLRGLMQPGNIQWTEQGFRLSWRVMLMEKTGSIEFRRISPQGKVTRVFPRESLTPLQYKMLATQPDLIVVYAKKLAHETTPPSAVYADHRVALNGRRQRRLVRPGLDLNNVTLRFFGERDYLCALDDRRAFCQNHGPQK